jgi:hypothetical protein
VDLAQTMPMAAVPGTSFKAVDAKGLTEIFVPFILSMSRIQIVQPSTQNVSFQ